VPLKKFADGSGMREDTVTFAVEGWEWDSLYKNPEDPQSPHPVTEGSVIEAQLSIWPKLIFQHWNKHSQTDELAYLDLGLIPDTKAPQKGMFRVKEASNLYLISGVTRGIRNYKSQNKRNRYRVNTLLDCGLPLILSEELTSQYVDTEGDFLVAIGLLYGYIKYSPDLFRVPVTGKVTRMTPLSITPRAVLIQMSLQPSVVVPDMRVSYHNVDTVDPRQKWQ